MSNQHTDSDNQQKAEAMQEEAPHTPIQHHKIVTPQAPHKPHPLHHVPVIGQPMKNFQTGNPQNPGEDPHTPHHPITVQTPHAPHKPHLHHHPHSHENDPAIRKSSDEDDEDHEDHDETTLEHGKHIPAMTDLQEDHFKGPGVTIGLATNAAKGPTTQKNDGLHTPKNTHIVHEPDTPHKPRHEEEGTKNGLQVLRNEEKSRQITLKKYITCMGIDVHNMLQDLRHVAIVDFRSPDLMSQGMIRDSQPFKEGNKDSWLGLVEFLKNTQKKATEQEEKYSLKKIRRALLILPEHSADQYQHAFEQVVEICKSNDVDLDKVYILTESIPTFKLEFNHLCVDDEVKADLEKQKYKDKSQPLTLQDFNKGTQQFMYSFSRFPFILQETQLLLGTTYNAQNRRQMKDLKVKTIVQFDTYKIEKGQENKEETKVEESEQDGIRYLKVTVNTQEYIDFDGLFEKIRTTPAPRLFCCSDDMKISANFAVAYLMKVQNMTVEKASLFVFSKMGSTVVNTLIYSQVRLYKPADSSTFFKLS